MIIGSRQRQSAQCDDVEIRIDGQIIKKIDHTKSLGFTIDAHFSFGVNTLKRLARKSLFSYRRPKTCAALLIYIQRNCNSNL